MKKSICYLSLAALVISLSGCGQTKTVEIPKLEEPVGVDMDTEKVVKMNLSGVTSYSAQVMPAIEELSFKSSGTVDELFAYVGDKVKKGQLLAKLSGSGGKAKTLKDEIKGLQDSAKDENLQQHYDIMMKKEELTNLKSQLAKEKLKANKVNLRHSIKELKWDIQIAQEKLKQQKEIQNLAISQKKKRLVDENKNLHSSKLYSTIAGEVVSTVGGSGYMVQGGSVAMQVANMERPRLKTTYIADSKIAKADRVVAEIDGKEYDIKVEEQELSREDIEMGKYPDNSWFDFVDKSVKVDVGTSASVKLYTDEVKDALVVPANSIYKGKEECYVYLVNGDAKTKQQVTIGTQTDAFVQIESGLKEGDVVYVEG